MGETGADLTWPSPLLSCLVWGGGDREWLSHLGWGTVKRYFPHSFPHGTLDFVAHLGKEVAWQLPTTGRVALAPRSSLPLCLVPPLPALQHVNLPPPPASARYLIH